MEDFTQDILNESFDLDKYIPFISGTLDNKVDDSSDSEGSESGDLNRDELHTPDVTENSIESPVRSFSLIPASEDKFLAALEEKKKVDIDNLKKFLAYIL